jgi:hypothetical protein
VDLDVGEDFSELKWSEDDVVVDRGDFYVDWVWVGDGDGGWCGFDEFEGVELFNV